MHNNLVSVFPKQIYVYDNTEIPSDEHNYLLGLPYVTGTPYREQNTSLNNYILDEVPSIKKFIEHHLFWYFQTVYETYQKIKITQSWCVKNDSVGRHIHKNSIISGAYYIDVDSEQDNLIFWNDSSIRKHIEWKHEESLSSYNSPNWDWNYFSIKTGRLILFPSCMEHSSIFNSSNRCVLSFNTWFDGNFGVNHLLSETTS